MRKHPMSSQTEYEIKDSSPSNHNAMRNDNVINGVVYKEQDFSNSNDGNSANDIDLHGLHEGAQVSVIGKVFKEENQIKVTIHHLELNKHHQKEVKLHGAEKQLDELVNGLKHNDPDGYQRYLAMLRRDQYEFEASYRVQREGGNQSNYGNDGMQRSQRNQWNGINGMNQVNQPNYGMNPNRNGNGIGRRQYQNGPVSNHSNSSNVQMNAQPMNNGHRYGNNLASNRVNIR